MAARRDYRSISLISVLRYRGAEGMWTWMLHRVTGLGILLFLVLHVADTGLVAYRPDWYDHALSVYKHPLFRVAEAAVFFAVLFHALNGVRIVVQDFWPVAMRHQRRLALTAAALALIGFLPAAWMMLAPIVGLAEEPGVERHRRRMETRPAVEAPASVRAEPDR